MVKAHKGVHKRLLAAAAVHGNGMKIVKDETGRSLSYRELVVGSVALARQLRPLSGQEFIGCLLPNTASALFAYFACHFIGKAPAILNYTHPAETLMGCCRQAGLDTLLTSRLFVEKSGTQGVVECLAAQGIRIVYLEDLARCIGTWAKVRALAESHLKRLRSHHGSASAPAVVLFTSGSEAEPKAVVLSHRALMANCEQVLRTFPLRKDEILFSALPHFHAFGLTIGVILPVLHGIPAVIGLSPLRHRENLTLISRERPTILLSTDSFLAQMRKLSTAEDLSSLRFIVAGAERVREQTRKVFEEELDIPLFEGYGATELSPVIAVNAPGASKPGTVGRLLPGIEHRVVPVDGCDTGGVLHVRGPNVMTSYIHDLKAGRSSLNDGWYDTGDIVAIDDEGFVTIQGRQKRFVKVAGEMISLGFIEDVIARVSPDHRHAILAQDADAKGKPAITLFSEDFALDLDTVRRHFAQQGIRNVYLPKRVVHTRELPLLRTGKVDYRALQDAQSSIQESAQ